MNKRKIVILSALLILIFGLTACSSKSKNAGISASGTIEADTVRVSPEIGGKVKENMYKKGDTVEAGKVLFKLDDDLLQAKYQEADAQVQLASANLDVVKQDLESAKIQYQYTLNSSQTSAGNVEANRWTDTTLNEIDLPNWYFQKSEKIAILQSAVDDAQKDLDEEQKSMDATLKKTSNQDFVNAETRVNKAQIAFEMADQTLDQAKKGVGDDKSTLTDAAQKIYDSAKTELDAAQKEYNALLTGTSATDVKEARARVSAAKANLENTQDELNDMLTRDDSLQVENARIAVSTAENAVKQAEANLAVAQANENEIEVQLSKMTVDTPRFGRDPFEPGKRVRLRRPDRPSSRSAISITSS
jgi:multidrug efflux pump subunit AcrA (membrane-fusion protein)